MTTTTQRKIGTAVAALVLGLAGVALLGLSWWVLPISVVIAVILAR